MANRVAAVVANEWKDDNDKVIPVQQWLDERRLLQAHPSEPREFPFILLRNKVDIDGGNSLVVSEKKVKEWCASKGNIPYFETSAKEDSNIDAACLCCKDCSYQ